MIPYTDVLFARPEAVAHASLVPPRSVVRIGRLTVDVDARVARVDGRRVHLTAMEYRVLELLSLGKGTALTRHMFMHDLYRGRTEPKPKIIDVLICKLRTKLAAAGGEGYIETVRGRGYTLRDHTPQEAAQTLNRIMRGQLPLHQSDGAGDQSRAEPLQPAP